VVCEPICTGWPLAGLVEAEWPGAGWWCAGGPACPATPGAPCSTPPPGLQVEQAALCVHLLFVKLKNLFSNGIEFTEDI
jgi:hypothetical protein